MNTNTTILEALTAGPMLADAIRTLREYGAWAAGRPTIPGTIGNPCKTGQAILTKPSKMPGYSWSIPAGNARNGQPDGTCPGAVFGINSICGSCYANPDSLVRRQSGELGRRGGNYDRRSVRQAQKARRDWTMRCLMTKEGMDEWVAVMTAAVVWATRTYAHEARAEWNRQGPIGRPSYGMPPKVNPDTRRILYFRVHDSGDMFSPKYAQMWQSVCANVSEVRFWIPTRSWHSTPRILTVLQSVNALPNVAVRPSALYLEEDAPVVPGLAAGTGAKSDGWNCPASSQGNECRSCRRCWSKGAPVYYHVH